MSKRVERGGEVLNQTFDMSFINFGHTAAFERHIFQFLKRLTSYTPFVTAPQAALY